MRFVTALCIVFLFITTTQAQSSPSKVTIAGKVVDDNTRDPLGFATVSAYDADEKLLEGTITAEDGTFQLKVASTVTTILVEFISYVDRRVAVRPTSVKLTVPDIGLLPNAAQLAEVQITAQKSEMQFSLDKKVFNVGQDQSSKGGSAQDILDNIPSVAVGVEGDVTLRGNGNVRILINGRPSGLVGISDASGLRSIQSSQIERVEVITNPSARYEAEGMGGIINIILKKERRGGFNGAFEVSAGAPLTLGAGANINYRQRDINFFFNYGYQQRRTLGFSNMYQEIYRPGETSVTYTDTDRDRRGIAHTLQGGMEFFITDNQTLTASLLYKPEIQNNLNETRYVFFPTQTGRRLGLEPRATDPYTLRTDDEREEETTHEYSLEYVNEIAGRDHRLSANVTYSDNVETESSFFDEDIYDDGALLAEDILLQRSANSEGQNSWRTQVDYQKPLGASVKMETGALATLRQIDNDFIVEEKIGPTFTAIPSLTNNFIYEEDVIGAYGIISREIEQWGYQLGLRTEYTGITTELITNGGTNDRDFFNFFPSAFISFKPTETTTLQASYSRRIRRPGFWELNPFFTFSDRRMQWAGNPDLNPELTDSYEVGYLKYWEKGNVGGSVYYRYTGNTIQRLQTAGQIDGEDVIFRQPFNVGTEQNIGLELNWAYTAIRKLKLDGSFNAYRFDTDGSSLTEDLSVDAWTYQGNVNARWSFWNNADFQVRTRHRGARLTLQGSRKAITMVDLGFSKDFLQDDMTLSISVRDLFNQRKRIFETDTEELYESGEFQWRARTAIATLSYRINTKKKRRTPSSGYGGGGGFG